MPTPVPHDVIFFSSAKEIRDWLRTNHGKVDELWLGYRPKASGLPSVTWEEVVDQCLCYGWIDGVRIRVEGGSAQRLTPRRAGSNWSARNVRRVEALRRAGRMRSAGEAAYAKRRDDRTAVYSSDGSLTLDDESGGAPLERQGMGLLGSTAKWLPPHDRPLGHERQAPRDPKATTRATHLRLGCRTSDRSPHLAPAPLRRSRTH
jgi:hypothetical protein